MYLVAENGYNNSGTIYTSNNYGLSWNITTAPGAAWNGIASDSTGKYLIAAAHHGYMYNSNDYGANWTQTAYDGAWLSVASDSTGKYLVAGTNSDIDDPANPGIYTGVNVQNTNFKVNGTDLSAIFYPLSGGGTAQPAPTGFRHNVGTLGSPVLQDLNTVFAPFTPGTTKAQATFFTSNTYGNVDLNQIFQNITVPP